MARCSSDLQDIPETNPCSSRDLSPQRKRQKKTNLCQGQKEMLVNIYKYSVAKNLQFSRTQHAEFAAECSGVSLATFYRVLDDYQGENTFAQKETKSHPRQVLDRVDDETKGQIRKIVHEFFFRNEPPTIDKILGKVNEDSSLPDFKRSTFRKLLLELKFRFLKRNRNSLMKEKNEIIAWRRRFLRSVKQYRSEGKQIYYLDETWVNAGHTVDKVWVDTKVLSARQAFNEGLSTGLKHPTGKGKRLIITHIGSEDGFVSNAFNIFESKKNTGDYHDEMNAKSFEEWFAQVLPQLDDNSVIVMDNAPYHSRKIMTRPTSRAKKMELLDYCLNDSFITLYCQKNNIQLTSKLLTSELRDLIKQQPKSNLYVCDEMAKAQGKAVLRLPPYHCELNPIELIWAQVKNWVAKKNTTFKLGDVKNLFVESVSLVTKDNWLKAVGHVQKVEQKMWEMDEVVETRVEPLIIKDSSSGSSSCSSD